jgi:hypothetical protein
MKTVIFLPFLFFINIENILALMKMQNNMLSEAKGN